MFPNYGGIYGSREIRGCSLEVNPEELRWLFTLSLREKCPNKFFLVLVFQY